MTVVQYSQHTTIRRVLYEPHYPSLPQFFEPTIDLALTYKMLKIHMKLLTYKACFLTINLTTEDIYLFECNPHEFVHHINSPLTKFYNPWMSSMTLITDIVKHCGKYTTQNLIGFLVEIMSFYS